MTGLMMTMEVKSIQTQIQLIFYKLITRNLLINIVMAAEDLLYQP